MKKHREEPLWFALMRNWVDTGRGTTGLTLPFLVGALWRDRGAVAGGKPDVLHLSNLLFASQTRTPAGSFIKISPCTELNQPVAKIYHGDSMIVAHTIDQPKGRSRLCIEVYEHTRTIASALPSLWTWVGDAIREARFSYRKGEARYVEFTEEDTRFINETKSLIAK